VLECASHDVVAPWPTTSEDAAVSAADAGGRGGAEIEFLDGVVTEAERMGLRLFTAPTRTIRFALASLAAARAERDAARDALIHLRYCARQAPYMAPEQNPGELLRDALRRADAALAPRASEPAAGGGK
jgi:hypothetical protein